MSFFRLSARIVVLALCVITLALFPASLYAKGSSQSDKKSTSKGKAASEQDTLRSMLVGTDSGLYSIDYAQRVSELWAGGSVKKIIQVDSEAGSNWVILGNQGIFVSDNLSHWEERNDGLPIKTIKVFHDGKKSFLPVVQDIKDVRLDPANPDIMVCAVKDSVYLSRNHGRDWAKLGMPSYRTNGIKVVAAAHMPESGGSVLTVFLSHSTYGIHYMQPDKPNAQWIELVNGLDTLETTGNADEVSDIAVRVEPLGETGSAPEIFVSQTFRHRIYRLNWEKKSFQRIWAKDSPFGTVDSLDIGKNAIRFLYEGTVAEISLAEISLTDISPADYTMQNRQDITDTIRSIPANLKPNCVKITISDKRVKANTEVITLSELWLLDEKEQMAGNAQPKASAPAHNWSDAKLAKADGKEGLYFPVNHAMDENRLKQYLNTIDNTGLNLIVIDMKDDYGRLRFTPHNQEITKKGRVFRPLDIEAFLKTMKEHGIYTVARIVVFKDPELAKKENHKYAVWDRYTDKPWRGFYDTRWKKTTITEEDRANENLIFSPADDPEYEKVRSFYDEHWVDPYSEDVWEYTAQIASELHERGFDEIQFDYIRFPTDGINLSDARYRWQDKGMDMESAILSFLRHVRSRVKAPISIDIYGANGWYRTGARTGQEVELLAPWIDVICPMYYPSHFEQDFLAQSPPEMRPYRIYYMGTLRTARIGRGQIVVRPYAQAFYLNVSYDRKYYDNDYVRRQLEAVRAAGSGGLIYWNNIGRYDDLPAKN